MDKFSDLIYAPDLACLPVKTEQPCGYTGGVINVSVVIGGNFSDLGLRTFGKQ